MWRAGPDTIAASGIISSDVLAGLRYTRYLKEHLATTFTIQAAGGQLGTVVTPEGTFSGISGLLALPIGVRWNPLQWGRQAEGIKPFVKFDVGPVIGDSSGSFSGRGTRQNGINTSVTIGGLVGGGVDLHFARSFAIGVDAGYNWMADFEHPVGGQTNHSGFALGLNIGWLFGRGTAARP
jgi:hypothetical protein